MKSLITLLSFFILSIYSTEKTTHNKTEFEGIITYKISVESKMNDVSSKELQEHYGTTMIKYFKDGNFKMKYNGKDINTIYFIKNDNKEYDYRNGIDTLFVTPYYYEKRKLIQSVFDKTETKILNRKCKLLIHKIENTSNYYWYDPSLYINPKNFEKSVFSFTNIYFKQTKSPWLKYKYDGKNLSITYTAIKISNEKLDKSIFTLPSFPKDNYR
jgi:hypothetical protein